MLISGVRVNPCWEPGDAYKGFCKQGWQPITASVADVYAPPSQMKSTVTSTVFDVFDVS